MIGNDWDVILKDEYEKEYFCKIKDIVRSEYNNKIIYPPANRVFYAFRETSYKDTRVVILGQDPYHGEGEAHGLSFSVREGVKMPPSLLNIFKELESDLGIKRTKTDLTDWAENGVLLLNSIMTVVKDSPLSHKDKGWEIFTDRLIELLGEREEPLVFIFWGSYARSKKNLIKNKKHLIIESVHPSPLSAHRGFFGSKPFSKTNEFLSKNNIEPINW